MLNTKLLSWWTPAAVIEKRVCWLQHWHLVGSAHYQRLPHLIVISWVATVAEPHARKYVQGRQRHDCSVCSHSLPFCTPTLPPHCPSPIPSLPTLYKPTPTHSPNRYPPPVHWSQVGRESRISSGAFPAFLLECGKEDEEQRRWDRLWYKEKALMVSPIFAL